MLFSVVGVGSYSSLETVLQHAYLIRDEWDDWFSFETQFYLVVFDSSGERHNVGNVKIGQAGMSGSSLGGQRRPDVPGEFDALPENFFSLGQDENYYETLFALQPDLRDSILHSLRDSANDLGIFSRYENEAVMKSSLLRFVSADTVRYRFSRIVKGDAELTAFNFSYQFPKKYTTTPPMIEFEVLPASKPPTNIHVMIGRNGVGKTTCLQWMTRALCLNGVDPVEVGNLSIVAQGDVPTGITGVVSVSFSAFDPFGPLFEIGGKIRYAYIGLRTSDKEGNPDVPKTVAQLSNDFVDSVLRCRGSARLERWTEALRTLESDPLFKVADVSSLATQENDRAVAEQAATLYRLLSSGHKIVLLTTTRLVETVDERTLVLLDEPEAHLHPPLLSAFVRALSTLLLRRNGVAIVATHSPVVLQEAPRSCVTIIQRSGGEVRADRPQIETFGENVGVLTREVFGLEVTQSGYHKLLEETVFSTQWGFDAIVASFGGQLGAEARALVSALLAVRDQQGRG